MSFRAGSPKENRSSNFDIASQPPAASPSDAEETVAMKPSASRKDGLGEEENQRTCTIGNGNDEVSLAEDSKVPAVRNEDVKTSRSQDELEHAVAIARTAQEEESVWMDLAKELGKGAFADWSMVQQILVRKPELAGWKIRFGMTVLHYACSCGAPLSLLRSILVSRPESLIEEDSSGTLPIFLACKSRASTEVFAVLVSVDLGRATLLTQNRGRLPLHEAFHSGLPPTTLRLLIDIERQVLLTRDSLGDLPLHTAFKIRSLNDRGSFELIRWLARDEIGRQALLEPNNAGDLPLHCACMHFSSVELIRLLTPDEDRRRALLRTNNAGDLPLHYALRYQRLEVIQELLNQCPESVGIQSGDGRLPVEIVRTRIAGDDERIIRLVEDFDQARRTRLSSIYNFLREGRATLRENAQANH